MDRLLSGINMDRLSIEQLLRRIGMKERRVITAQTGYTFEFEYRIDPNIRMVIIAKSEAHAWMKIERVMGGKQ